MENELKGNDSLNTNIEVPEEYILKERKKWELKIKLKLIFGLIPFVLAMLAGIWYSKNGFCFILVCYSGFDAFLNSVFLLLLFSFPITLVAVALILTAFINITSLKNIREIATDKYIKEKQKEVEKEK